MRILKLLVALLLVSQNGSSDPARHLGGFFNKLGSHVNATGAAAYKGQSAGYYTGGNLFVRNEVEHLKLAGIRMPGISAGCGGIDAHFGGMSFINAEQFTKFFRAMGSAAIPYALMLGVETMCPKCKNTMSELNAIAEKANSLSIGSCESAAALVGSVWPKSERSQEYVCKSFGAQAGRFSDHVKARHGCGAGGERKSVLDAAASDPKYKGILSGEFNVAWEALMKDSEISGDKSLAEFFMTLSGTIISKDPDSENPQMIQKRSKTEDDALFNALLYGGKGKVYKCGDPEKCLNVSEVDLTITEENGYVSKVRKRLDTMLSKIYSDTALEADEQKFLQIISLPVYKMLNVAAAYSRGANPVDIQSYAELIALDIIYQYLGNILTIVNDLLGNMKNVQVDATHITNIQKDIRQAKNLIISKRKSAYQHVQQLLSLINQTKMRERQLHASAMGLVREGA